MFADGWGVVELRVIELSPQKRLFTTIVSGYARFIIRLCAVIVFVFAILAAQCTLKLRDIDELRTRCVGIIFN